MRRRLRAALPRTLLAGAWVVMTATVVAAEWEVEASLGAGEGSHFGQTAPFEFQGLAFGGPYNVCKFPTHMCALFGTSGDIVYGLRTRHSFTGLAGIEVHRPVGSSTSAVAGVLAGVAPRWQRLFRQPVEEVIYTRPPEPDDLRAAALERGNMTGRTTGVAGLAYLHAGLRYEIGFGGRDAAGYRRPRISVFFEGGGGLLPVIPGGASARIGRPAGVHAAAGLRLNRGLSSDLTVTVTHVQALAGTDHLVDPRFAWTVARVGFVFDR